MQWGLGKLPSPAGQPACVPQKDVVPYPLHVRKFGGSFAANEVVVISSALTTLLLAQTPGPGVSSGKHPFTFEEMMKLKRVGAPVPSPDGKWVAFDGEDVDLEANTKISHLWIVPASGGESRRLNPTPNDEERPRFSPDGKRLIWTSKATDPTQIWMCDFDSGKAECWLGGTTAGNNDLDGRRRRDLVTGWKEYPVRVVGISGLPG